jgi:hypothetical protein
MISYKPHLYIHTYIHTYLECARHLRCPLLAALLSPPSYPPHHGPGPDPGPDGIFPFPRARSHPGWVPYCPDIGWELLGIITSSS